MPCPMQCLMQHPNTYSTASDSLKAGQDEKTPSRGLITIAFTAGTHLFATARWISTPFSSTARILR